MINTIINYILEFKYYLFGIAFFLLILLFIMTSIKKGKFIILTFSLMLIPIVLALLYEFEILKFRVFELDLIFSLAALSLLCLIVSFVYYIITSTKLGKVNRIIEATINLDDTILAYLDSNSKLLFFTDHFYKYFKNTKLEFSRLVRAIDFEGDEYTYKNLKKVFNQPEEKDYHFEVSFKDGTVLEVDFFKRKVIRDSKLIAYTLLSKEKYVNINEEKQTLIEDELNNYLNLIDSAIMYFNESTKKYVMNKEMMRLVGLSENSMTEAQFIQLIMREDSRFYNQSSNAAELKKTIFRIKTTSGNLWFEKTGRIIDSINYTVVRHTTFSKYKKDYESIHDLQNNLRQVLDSLSGFALFKIRVNDLDVVEEKIGLDAAMVVINQYFTDLTKELGVSNLKIYKESLENYYLVIHNKETYDMILTGLSNKSSFVYMSLSFNEIPLRINNHIGIVSREQFETMNPDAYIEAVNTALNFSRDPNYPNNYSLYTAIEDSIDLDFRESGIDLSDDFLDDIIK